MQIKIFYKKTFNIDFPQNMRDLLKAVSNRHDIVHRCGKSKEGEILTLTKENVLELKNSVSTFINLIDQQLEEKIL